MAPVDQLERRTTRQRRPRRASTGSTEGTGSVARVTEQQERGDLALAELLDKFEGRLISPGGAAKLLGVKRQTVEVWVRRGRLRQFHAPVERYEGEGPRWVYVPLDDVYQLAAELGRPLPRRW